MNNSQEKEYGKELATLVIGLIEFENKKFGYDSTKWKILIGEKEKIFDYEKYKRIYIYRLLTSIVIKEFCKNTPHIEIKKTPLKLNQNIFLLFPIENS